MGVRLLALSSLLMAEACLGEYTLASEQTTGAETEIGASDAETGTGGEGDVSDDGAESSTEGEGGGEVGGDTTGDAETEGPSPCDEDDGELLCSGSCVDIFVDESHCGGCDEQCSELEVCEIAECRRPCPCDAFTELCTGSFCGCRAGLQSCEEGCVDLHANQDNCGACEHFCEAGTVCNEGRCEAISCPDNECAGACVELDSDPVHCGVCGNACLSNELCFQGACWEYGDLDPRFCDSCPCEESCESADKICCSSVFLGRDVCVDANAMGCN